MSELLVAITIQHEGYNRSKLVQGRLDRWLENKFPFKNDTVGVGQMRPDLARGLAHQHFDIYDDLSEAQLPPAASRQPTSKACATGAGRRPSPPRPCRRTRRSA